MNLTATVHLLTQAVQWAADSTPSVIREPVGTSPTITLVLGIISGIAAVTASVFGYLGIIHRNKQEQPDNPTPPAPPLPGSDEEPPWVRHLRREITRLERENNRLEQLCIKHRINPRDGSLIG